jgi:Holliday junction resolvase RusA-like endonuclease
MKVPVNPLGKPRQSRQDKWRQRPCVVRYRAFCDALRDHYGATLPAEVRLVFQIPMPASWSRRKKAELAGTPHGQKPDLDNCIKAVLDALCEEDSHVWRVDAEKRWAESGAVEIYPLVKDRCCPKPCPGCTCPCPSPKERRDREGQVPCPKGQPKDRSRDRDK